MGCRKVTELSNAVHSCSRYGVAAARSASEPTGSVTRFSKTFAMLGLRQWLLSPFVFNPLVFSALRQNLASNLVATINYLEPNMQLRLNTWNM